MILSLSIKHIAIVVYCYAYVWYEFLRTSESENEDDPATGGTEGQTSGADPVTTPKEKRKTTKGNVTSAVKALTQVNVQLEAYSKDVTKNQKLTISLMKEDVENAKKYRDDSIELKRQANLIRSRKFKLLKKYLDNQQ